MTYVYFERHGDINEMQKYSLNFECFSDSELKEACEKQQKLGIVGVHQQALYLIALRQEMHKRFGDSPILFENNSLVKIKSVDSDIEPTINQKSEIERLQFMRRHQNMLSRLVTVGYENLTDEERAYWNSVY